MSQIGLVASVQVGQPRVRPGPIGATFWTKQSRERSLWHDVMTGTDCILCKVLSILHLSWKTETENTILLSGFYEITAWKIHFWGHMCISVSMCEREREKSNYSGTLERQTIGFIRLSKVSYCENSFIKALTCLASSFAV